MQPPSLRARRPLTFPLVWAGALDELAAALAFALKFEGRKRQHDADAFMADIVAKRLVRYLERARYVVMKRPPLGGHSALGRGFER